MRVSCLQENLAKGLGTVRSAVSTRSTLPVLANVLISTDNGRLKLSATNLEVAITKWIDAKVNDTGAITLPARTFSDLIGSLPQETIELELSPENQTVHVACASTEANIKGIDAEEFPLVPVPDLTQALSLRADVFKQMLNQVTFAAATDETRPQLTGVAMQFGDGNLELAATDAFRLSVRTSDLPSGGPSAGTTVIVPARALSELAKIIQDGDEPVYLIIPDGRNQIIFQTNDVVLVSQLIEGTFPDFSPIIPKKWTTRAIVSTASLINACKTANIFARESSHTARVKIVPGNELQTAQVVLSATSAETGDNVVQVDSTVEGNEVEITFNVSYLSDVLSIINTPQVAIETTTSMEPGVIRPVGDEEFFHIIMPMHSGR